MKESTMQLAFATIIVIVVAILGFTSMSWMAERFGDVGALMAAVLMLVVIIIFVQQYLSNSHTHNIMKNLVEYSTGQARVEEQRQKASVELIRGAREASKVDHRLTLTNLDDVKAQAREYAKLMNNQRLLDVDDEDSIELD